MSGRLRFLYPVNRWPKLTMSFPSEFAFFRDLCSGFGPLLTVVIFPRGEPVEARMRTVVIVVVARGAGQVSAIA
ncbi:hypothetical protein PhaeoP30_03772 (plasmid) [Phaeobacter inhibens]|nr:hypothetical protein PhaeoP30_03772 [Phaeobacter inhibens]